jgi:hypothetical protein
MISLAPLALLAIVGMAIWAVVDRARRSTATGQMYLGDPAEPDTVSGSQAGRAFVFDLRRALERWSDAGIITPDQALAMEEFEAARAARPSNAPRRIPLIAEALGYIGGSLGLAGLALLTARYWPDMPTGARVAIGVTAAVAFTVAGVLVPHRQDATLDRLRQFVWTAASGGVALAAAVLMLDVVGSHHGGTIAFVIAGSMTLHSGALWKGDTRPMQQAICMIAGLVTFGALVEQWAAGTAIGIAVWALALGLLALGLWHVVSTPELTLLIGGAGAMVGAAMVDGNRHGTGLLIGVATAATFIALVLTRRPVYVRTDRVVIAVVAVVATLGTLPATLIWFARQAGIATGLTLWVIGATALAAARSSSVRLTVTAQFLGGVALVGGAALTGAQSIAFATIFGATIAVILVVLATMPNHALLSIFGSAGLLVNVPWGIHHFFPGEGRVPLLILVCGVLIVGVAVWLSRLSGELHHEFHLHLRHH